MVLKVG
jgi:hypothetical protein